MAHHKVYVRLGRSPVHGVGVFAIRKIPKNINVFGVMCSIPTVNVDGNVIKKLPHHIQKLYLDFCVRRGDMLYCPQNFNDMNIGWYVNHSSNPNVRVDQVNQELYFMSIRRIEKGEELLVDYNTYSD